MYLRFNKLKLNLGKTQILRTTTRQQLAGNGRETLELETRNDKGEKITPNSHAKLLGVTFNSNLLWTNHLLTGKDALIPKLKQSLGALRFSSSHASIKVKKGWLMG